MNLRTYIFLMSIGSILCWIAWIYTLFTIDPTSGNWLSLVLFYASLFLAILGTSSIVGFLFHKIIVKNDEIVFRHVKNTFRRSILLSTTVLSLLLFQSARLLTWWNLILLVFMGIFLELIIFSKRRFSSGQYV